MSNTKTSAEAKRRQWPARIGALVPLLIIALLFALSVWMSGGLKPWWNNLTDAARHHGCQGCD